MAAEDHPTLFPLPDPRPAEPEIIRPERPIWTQSKAQLIALYLHYFVLITKHGTYIDGFAGPQDEAALDSWAAKLVLESEPRWLRHFYLCDCDPKQVEMLERLRKEQPELDSRGRPTARTIEVFSGDFNERVYELLSSGSIGNREATFCLLDQRTFECEWATVAAMARHKRDGHKVEIFYFFPVKWLDRALSALQDEAKLGRWWGRDDWEELRSVRMADRVFLLVERFRDELGYASAKPWPIYERQDGGAVMYYMVHATDHPDAPGLMSRAYRKAVTSREEGEQLRLFAAAEFPLKRR